MKNKNLLIYIFIHSLISGLYYLVMVKQFYFPVEAIYLHLYVIVVFHLLLFFIFFNLPKTRKIVLAINLLLCIYWFSLLVLYVLNWFSYLNWGGAIMFDFIVYLPKQVWSLANTNDVPIYLIVIGAVLLLLLIYLIISKSNIINYRLVPISKKLRLRMSLYMASFLAVFVMYVSFSYARNDPRNWIYEPFFSAATENNSDFKSIKGKAEVIKDQKERLRIQDKLSGFSADTNVVLIIVDALRADRLPLYGYYRDTTPFIDGLSQKENFQYVKNFTSTCSESICGIYSILSSRRFPEFGFGLLDLTEVLKTIGYKNYFLLSSNHNFNSLTDLYGEQIDVFFDGRDFANGLSLNDDQGVIDKLKTINSYDGTPGFFYIHLMSAHLLGKNKEKYKKFLPQSEHSAGLLKKVLKNGHVSEEYAVSFSNGYDNGVLQTDNYIKQSLKILDEKGFLDNSLIIITSDHGDGLGEHGSYSHTYNLFQEDIDIPFLWLSKNCNLKNTRYGTHIDVAPTILDCLGSPTPKTWKGESLLSPYQPSRITFHQTIRNKKTVMMIEESYNHMYKLMAEYFQGEFSHFQLFDVYSDPKELNDLTDTINSSKLNDLKDILMAHFKDNE